MDIDATIELVERARRPLREHIKTIRSGEAERTPEALEKLEQLMDVLDLTQRDAETLRELINSRLYKP